ncbi:MAG: ABC transporter permease [Actinomycetota bacterium]|nr:ABC transporter permease [Actinomycetota bacterium]
MSRGRRRLVPYFLLGPGLLWLFVFFAIPMAFMGYISLNSGSIEDGFSFTSEWTNFGAAFGDYGSQFGRSFLFAGIATLFALLIAYPLAYTMAFHGGKWKNALLLIVIAPFFTTYLIRTLAWQTILADEGAIVDVLSFLAVVPEGEGVLKTPGSVIAGITYNFLPFMVLPIYASLEQMDQRLIEAARDLYATSRQAFLRVTLPLSAPGVIAGVLLTFIPAFGDYINAIILGGTGQAMIGNVIQSQYLLVEDYPLAAALSFVVMAIMLALVLVYIRFAGSEALMGDETEESR